jgi:hypothetical protein
MCCDDLVCARCAGPVAEGRCPACRAARAALHHGSFTLTPQMVIWIVMALVALMVVVYHV